MINILLINSLQTKLNKPRVSKTPSRTLEDLEKEAKKIDAAKHKRYDKKKKSLEEKTKEEYQEMLDLILNPTSTSDDVSNPVKEEKEWDVKIGDPIEYFDPDLSYELTGYRPITKDKGLDFDPKLFTVAADNYRLYGKYTQLYPGTFAHRQYWWEEFLRCTHGITIGKYTLTGENYFWLNYYRLPSVLDKSGAELQEENFPTFLAKQYEYFHYLNMCRILGKDGVAFKARGVGASLIAASNLACAYTFHKNTRNIVTAFADRYVDDTLSKVWNCLDFLNTQTEGAFTRVRMKTDTARVKVASQVDKQKNEFGWKSRIEGVTTDEPRKLRGGRTYSLYFEEGGSHPKILQTYIQSRALVEINGYRVGSRFVFGTAGDTGPNLAGLKDMFYNPKEFFMLPYKNNYMQSGMPEFTGYFIPSYTMWFGNPQSPGFDSRGVVDEDRAKQFYLALWENIIDPKKLLQDKAEYCFTPEDAFILEGLNQFDQEKLADQLHAILDLKIIDGPRRMTLRWPMDGDTVDRDLRPLFEDTSTGKILYTELPLMDEHGIPFNNLYVCGCDSIDVDSSTSTGLTDVSQFCVVVMRRAYGTNPPKVVAIYKDRPKKIQDAFDNALKLCQFYNCKMLVEATRISIKTHFERYHKLDYLMRRPKATANTTTKTNFKQFGVPATQAIIEHQLDLIEQYIADYCEYILFPTMLLELISYSYEAKRKFDIVAAFGICLLADEDMLGKIARPTTAVKKIDDVGYYTNEFGLKVFGIIKKVETSTMHYGWTREPNYLLNRRFI